MIVGFLDLLGFSPLLDLSAEVAMDNVFSFNHAIKTRVIGRMAYPEYTLPDLLSGFLA